MSISHYPATIFAAALVVQELGALLGHHLRSPGNSIGDVERSDFNTILGATLTLSP